MKDDVLICNMALGYLGISQTIADLQREQSNEARNCRIFFDSTRELVLEEAPWPFAERTAALQDIGSPPPGWAFRYRYPNDCVNAREIIVDGLTFSALTDIGGRTVIPQFRLPAIPFKVVEDEAGGGRAIVTNQQSASLVYTARITNPNVYPMSFIDAFALCLAAKIGGPLAAAPGMAEKAGDAYTKALLKAASRTMNEGVEQEERESEFTAARR